MRGVSGICDDPFDPESLQTTGLSLVRRFFTDINLVS